MNQSELSRALSRATGESARRLRRIGFSLVAAPARPPRRRPGKRPAGPGRDA